MPRILGIDLPADKPTHISLRYIYGIGATTAIELCEKARVDPLRKANQPSDEEIARLAGILDREYVVEGQLRRQVQQNIARLKDIGCYRGLRHRPCRAAVNGPGERPLQGSHFNVAGKKGVKEMRG